MTKRKPRTILKHSGHGRIVKEGAHDALHTVRMTVGGKALARKVLEEAAKAARDDYHKWTKISGAEYARAASANIWAAIAAIADKYDLKPAKRKAVKR